MRHASLLGAQEPLLWKLVPALTSQMGEAFPELRRSESLISETLKLEETRVRKTLSRGLDLLDTASAGLSAGDSLDGETAFKLYDTYGFQYDLTEDALRARGIGVDRDGFGVAPSVEDLQRFAGSFTGREPDVGPTTGNYAVLVGHDAADSYAAVGQIVSVEVGEDPAGLFADIVVDPPSVVPFQNIDLSTMTRYESLEWEEAGTLEDAD